jgi:hypothetical protein
MIGLAFLARKPKVEPPLNAGARQFLALISKIAG